MFIYGVNIFFLVFFVLSFRPLKKKGLNTLRKVFTFLSTALLLAILSLSFTGLDLKAKAASDLYPLPAPIIDVFPDDGLAKDMARNLNKDSVNDVIDQDDLDALTSLGFETHTITNDSMQLLERAMFNNVTDVSIMEFGAKLTESLILLQFHI